MEVRRLVPAALAWVALPASATADSVTLAPHKLQLTITDELNLSTNKELEPVSIAPDVSYGATRELMVSFVDSTYGVTGFRGAAGDGLCVSGTTNGCTHVYSVAGAEAVYGLVHGAVAVGAVGGLYSLDLPDSFADLKVGAKSRLTYGNAFVVFNPSLYLGLNKRDTNGDQLYLPLGLGYKLDPQFAVGIGSGIKGPVKSFADKFTVPLGFNAVVTLDPRLSVGAAFTWGKLWGAKPLRDMMPKAIGDDFRALQIWVAVTL